MFNIAAVAVEVVVVPLCFFLNFFINRRFTITLPDEVGLDNTTTTGTVAYMLRKHDALMPLRIHLL